MAGLDEQWPPCRYGMDRKSGAEVAHRPEETRQGLAAGLYMPPVGNRCAAIGPSLLPADLRTLARHTVPAAACSGWRLGDGDEFFRLGPR